MNKNVIRIGQVRYWERFPYIITEGDEIRGYRVIVKYPDIYKDSFWSQAIIFWWSKETIRNDIIIEDKKIIKELKLMSIR